jgi:glycosyltransferase involved in cell wall biosynthesis
MSGSISVIIPAYNAEAFISKALGSVIDQELPAQEIIVVDDGSKDNTCNVVSSFSNVQYIYQENAGVSSAMNLGIQSSKGEFIAFLDPDDYWNPCHLSEALRVIQTAGTVWGFTAVKVPQNYYKKSKRHWENLIKGNCYFDNFFSAWGAVAPFCSNGLVIKRDVLSMLGGVNSQLQIGEDLDLYFRVGAKYPRVAFSPKICVGYNRNRPGSLTSNFGGQPGIYMYLLDELAAFSNSMSNQDKQKFLGANQRLSRYLWGIWYHKGDLSYLRMLLSKGIDLPLKAKVLVLISVKFPFLVRLAIRTGKVFRNSLQGLRK